MADATFDLSDADLQHQLPVYPADRRLRQVVEISLGVVVLVDFVDVGDVYDDMPPYVPHGWKYLTFDKDGWLYVAFGPPCNECLPPTSTSQIRHINPTNGAAEIVALGIRQSVGGDIDPRTGDYWFSENARDWLGEDIPGDKLNHIAHVGEHFGYPYCHQGDIPDPKYAMGQSAQLRRPRSRSAASAIRVDSGRPRSRK